MKRWPIIRHIRYFWNVYHFNKWWNGIGQHLGAFPNEADLKHLEDIWEGRA